MAEPAGQLRRWLYLGARALGDYQAARRGPAAMGRRVVRRRSHRLSGRATARVLRNLGL